MPGAENTIFVITGDHSSGIVRKNKLDMHHVPLIIWSPMLKAHAEFDNIVTHNDITPSLTALLKNKNVIEASPTTHYIGRGLQTASNLQRLLMTSRNRDSKQMVYGDFFIDMDKNDSASIYRIDKNLNLSKVESNDSLRNKLTQMLYIYSYIYRYTYANDKLSKKQWAATDLKADRLDYQTTDKELICKNPDYKPSEGGNKAYNIFPAYAIEAGKEYKKIRMNLDATVVIKNDDVNYEEYFYLEFVCYNKKSPSITSENILMAIKEDKIEKDKPYRITLSKEFVYEKDEVSFCTISIVTTNNDLIWNPNYEIGITDATYSIEGLY